MEYSVLEAGVYFSGWGGHNPGESLDCGQAFRWKEEGGIWTGCVQGRLLRLIPQGTGVLFAGVSGQEFDTVWKPYFDFERDYTEIARRFSADERLMRAVQAYPDLRLLKQDPWETIASFIISQNNTIVRIKSIIERLCLLAGDPIAGAGAIRAFPAAEAICRFGEEELKSALRCGYRGAYLIDAAKRIADGSIPITDLYRLPLSQAVSLLRSIKGVGEKVARCILLYGFARLDCLPVDTWVSRILSCWYPQGLPPCTQGLEGLAQQYLFHYARMHPKELETRSV